MTKLPKGYYAVQSDLENSPKDRFTYKGVTYEAEEGVNLFSTLKEAAEAATDTPCEVLPGLAYDKFATPVVLFSSGEHEVYRFNFPRNMTLLGEKAGISPNLPTCDPASRPALNPEFLGGSRLVGSYWFGLLDIREWAVDTVIVDGFEELDVRFNDVRNGGNRAYISIKNIHHLEHCGWTLYNFIPYPATTPLVREVSLSGIRVTDFDDLDYGGNFLLLCAHKATLSDICYDTTGQVFGPTNIPHTVGNFAKNCAMSELVIENSYFANMEGENGISTGCYDIGNAAYNITVRGCIFFNASRKNCSPLRPHLATDNCRISVIDSTFVDTRGNSAAALSAVGTGENICFENCRIEGFSGEWEHSALLPDKAPEFINTTPRMTDCEDPHRVLAVEEDDLAALHAFYEGRRAYYGDLHVHTRCGGTSDGSTPMNEWPDKMDALGLDFAAVVDHRQMRGFFLPEWDEERFIIGTEPAANLFDLNACRFGVREVHYNMLFPHKYGLAMVLANFPEYEFHGDELTGSFKYPGMTKERFYELTEYVKSIGGIMVHPHPKTMLSSDDPMDYYFGERTFLETLYEKYDSHASFKNYDLWVSLLNLGKHVLTSSGSDTHRGVTTDVVSVFYTSEKSGNAFFRQMRTGDFAVGAVGMKMMIDGNPMGSENEYREGSRLVLCLDDYFQKAIKENTAYELRVYSDRGLVYSSLFDCKKPQTLCLEVQKRRFYRAEVVDLTHEHRIGIGNPIWLDK